MRVRDEDGQVLLLALGFLVFFGLVVGALVSFSGASVLASQRLRDQRSETYAADGAIDVAIQTGRTDKAVGAFGAAPCMDASPFTSGSNGMVATIDCLSTGDALSLDRSVRFQATVAGQVVVVATVLYHETAPGAPSDVYILDWTYCGHDPGACSP